MHLSRFAMKNRTRKKARLRPVSGHKRALWTLAILAPISSVLSPLPPVMGGAVLATAQSTHRKPAANRQAAQRISAVCYGERRHDGGIRIYTLIPVRITSS